MNEIVFKIYIDLFMLDIKTETIIINKIIRSDFPIFHSKKDAERKIEELIKNRGEILNDEDVKDDCLYLRFSIYRQLEKVKDMELEMEINQTIFARYIEIFNKKKLNL